MASQIQTGLRIISSPWYSTTTNMFPLPFPRGGCHSLKNVATFPWRSTKTMEFVATIRPRLLQGHDLHLYSYCWKGNGLLTIKGRISLMPRLIPGEGKTVEILTAEDQISKWLFSIGKLAIHGNEPSGYSKQAYPTRIQTASRRAGPKRWIVRLLGRSIHIARGRSVEQLPIY